MTEMIEVVKAIIAVIGVFLFAGGFIFFVDCGTYNGLLQTWLRKREKEKKDEEKMDNDTAISDKKVRVAFKSIMLRVTNEVIDDMIETSDTDNLNSANFVYLLEEKFKKFEELLHST